MRICMKVEKVLMEKIQPYIDSRQVSELAEKAGLSQPTMSRFAHGQSIAWDKVVMLLDYFSIEAADPGVDTQVYKMIPKVEGKAGAGSSFENSNRIQGYYAFRHAFLSRHGISPDHSVLMEVMGHSMEPLICDGDNILIDLTQKDFADGQIFLVTLGEELLIKKVHRTLDGFELVSVNPDYSPIKVLDSELSNFQIHGRVRWFGRVI